MTAPETTSRPNYVRSCNLGPHYVRRDDPAHASCDCPCHTDPARSANYGEAD